LRYISRTIDVIAALAPAIDKGLASTILISSPPILHIAAVAASISIALDLSFDKGAVLTFFSP